MLGFAVGGASAIVPVFLGETAPKRIRGTLVAVDQMMIVFGQFLAFSMNAVLARMHGGPEVTLANDVVNKSGEVVAKAGDKVSLALRPEAGSIAEGAKGDTALTGEVVSSNFLGSVIRTRMKVGDAVISFDMFNAPGLNPPAVGEIATLRFTASDLLIIRE